MSTADKQNRDLFWGDVDCAFGVVQNRGLTSRCEHWAQPRLFLARFESVRQLRVGDVGDPRLGKMLVTAKFERGAGRGLTSARVHGQLQRWSVLSQRQRQSPI
jgi:hypothetical protein